jgi:hypothetical protein
LFVVTDANFLSLLPKKNDPSPSFSERLSTLFNPFQQFEDIGKSIEELAQEHAIYLQKSVEGFTKKKSTVAANRKSILSSYSVLNDENEAVKEKRGVTEEVEFNQCVNNGYMGNITKEMNTCQGKNCTVAELSCNGVIVDVVTNGPPASIEGCFVTKLLCSNTTYEYPVSDSCTLQKVLCNNSTEYNGDQIVPIMIDTCQVQIGCGFKFYGFEVFNYYCANEELECDGVIVTDPTGRPVNATQCHKVSTPCTDVSVQSQCTAIGTTCPGSVIDTLCTPMTLDGTCQNDQSKNCMPKIIQCGGENYDYNTFLGPLIFCENILSVTCDNQVTSLHSENEFCRIAELTCDGKTQPFVSDIPANCSVSKMVCANRENILDCRSVTLGCKTENCVYEKQEYPCHDKCNQMATYEGCVCPLDFGGSTCATPRPFTCELFKVGPEPQCVYQKDAETGLIYDQDPVCYSYKMDNTIEFEFLLSCGFADGNYRMNQTKEGNFTYLVVTEKMALSRMPPWALRQRIFNFVYLSDNDQNNYYQLNQRQLATKESIKLSWSPKNLDPARYIFGKRIYTETRIASDGLAPIKNEAQTIHRIFIDVTDAKFVSSGNAVSRTNWGVIAVSIIGVGVALAIIGSIIYTKCKK